METNTWGGTDSQASIVIQDSVIYVCSKTTCDTFYAPCVVSSHVLTVYFQYMLSTSLWVWSYSLGSTHCTLMHPDWVQGVTVLQCCELSLQFEDASHIHIWVLTQAGFKETQKGGPMKQPASFLSVCPCMCLQTLQMSYRCNQCKFNWSISMCKCALSHLLGPCRQYCRCSRNQYS